MRSAVIGTFVSALALSVFTLGCSGAPEMDDETTESVGEVAQAIRGEFAFKRQTFGGNGRTCVTCHDDATGSVSPASANARFLADPGDPLFRPLDSDDGVGGDYTRMLAHATIRVGLALPAGVTLARDPGATSVVVQRGIPTTLNTPALDPVLMADGREPSLASQAKHAVHGHAEATRAPSPGQLKEIVAFESGLFSRPELAAYAAGGDAPALPEGVTDAERRGKTFFDPVAATADEPLRGFCAHCHGGPMLNETNAFAPPSVPVGSRFADVRVSARNALGLPLISFVFASPTGNVTVTTPDPGRALITGNVKDANKFKIPSLWGASRTAPFFHDNSAATPEEVAAHYDFFLRGISRGALSLSAQQQADIAAYLRLL
jgi:hypothetical protein